MEVSIQYLEWIENTVAACDYLYYNIMYDIMYYSHYIVVCTLSERY